MREKFSSLEQVAAYIDKEQIECLECGRVFSILGRHLKQAHNLTCYDYRQLYGLPAMTPLAGKSYRAFHRDKANRMRAAGTLTNDHLPDATIKAASVSKPKIGVAKKAHAELMAEKRKTKPHLPPGGKRKSLSTKQ